MTIKAPFPWFGGKSKVAHIVWERFGANIPNYVEPFFGSGAVLLERPEDAIGTETVNDLDGFVANFWRALQYAPDEVIKWADWPVNENDLHARHAWLVRNHLGTLQPMLEGDPDYYDAKVAGWWVWGICQWIGGGWCSGRGPWQANENGVLAKNGENGVARRIPHLSGGKGVHRASLAGVKRQRPHLGDAGAGVHQASLTSSDLYAYMQALSARMRRVRVTSGDWARIVGPSPTYKLGLTGVFLDPPYSDLADRDSDLYATDSLTVAHDCRTWAMENGDNPLLRIALCGYTGEHDENMLSGGWTPFYWKANGGYANRGNGKGKENAKKEVIWFSPHCLKPSTNDLINLSLFEEEE